MGVGIVVNLGEVLDILFQFVAHLLVLVDLPPVGGNVPLVLLDLVVKGQVASIDIVDYVCSLPYPGRVRFRVGLLGLQLIQHLQLFVVGILEVRFFPLEGEEPPLLEFHLEKGIINLLLYILSNGIGPQ